MYSFLLSTATTTNASDTPLTAREALSGAFGSISIACWIFVLVPQFVENYRNSSAEAVSLAFVIIWLVGDVTNLLGGFWAELVPTAIALAVWFCFTDTALIAQSLYYNIRNRRRQGQAWLAALRQSVSGDTLTRDAAEAVSRVRQQQQQQQQEEAIAEDEDEEQPLLKRTASNNINSTQQRSYRANGDSAANNNMTPAQRRSSIDNEMIRHRLSSNTNSHVLAKILEEQDTASGTRLWLKNIFSVLAIWLIGAVGWYISYKTGVWKPSPVTTGPHVPGEGHPPDRQAQGGQVLGYISAIAYLGARIPQIVKNWREQSCEGLSLLFFVLSLFGNLTYGISFFCHSTDRDYIIPKIPWLIGSMGTIVEDLFIFVQFRMYSGVNRDREVAVVE